MANHGVAHLRRILTAFDGIPETEAVATVTSDYHEPLGPLPRNVVLVDPLPLHLLLGHCQAMVHHGGSGTAMTACSFGLPQLVLPQLADQFAHGDQIAAVGAGLSFDDATRQDDDDLLHKSLTALVSEPGYTAAAVAIRDEMAAMPAPARIVMDLERVARGEVAELCA
jgi:UDP:flavonoid glycosyltransferase YjiC (YdhE family)